MLPEAHEPVSSGAGIRMRLSRARNGRPGGLRKSIRRRDKRKCQDPLRSGAHFIVAHSTVHP
ncbi:unnamed protein product [Protopolystoma xenopodis]|uniref:Uncharacterized protein n=1 Tax=Protopolystoma xenopodis TaxID=117903 RepID=A0A3S5AX82_9PLAT|nr:unnamed protein product [Protopolystoma xenopodis]